MSKEDVRELLVDAAVKRFEHYGYKKTTIDEIAVDAGISKGAVYLHFSSKEELLYECIKKHVSERISQLEEISAVPGSALDRLSVMVIDWVEQSVERRSRIFGGAPMESEISPPTKEKIKGMIMPVLQGSLKKLIVEGVESGELNGAFEPETAAEVISAQIYYLLVTVTLNPDYDWRQAWEKTWGLLKLGFVTNS